MALLVRCIGRISFGRVLIQFYYYYYYSGGEKFLVQNILFKICTDHYGVFGGDEYYAHKLASHELKGLINIYNYGSKLGLYPLL